MGWLRSEEEADKMIEAMMLKGKGKYITQGVSFNKESSRQMELLKMVLMRSGSFSGFIKEKLAEEFEQHSITTNLNSNPDSNTFSNTQPIYKKNTGNFLD